MGKLRDEQKGIIFLVLIFLIIVGVSVFFFLSLKTDTIKDILESEKLVRLLLVVEEDDSNELFSTLIIYDPNTHKAASYHLPNYTGTIFQSLGRTDTLEAVYNEKGINVYRQEVETLLGIKSIPFTAVIKMQNFIKITDMLGGMRIFIPSEIDQIDEDGNRWLLPSGAVILDGDKISSYLHYRIEDEDETDIIDRYQNVTGAFLTGLHDNSFTIFNNRNFKAFADCIDSNLVDEDEKSLFKMISEVDSESIIRQTITGSLRTVEGKIMLLPLNNGDFVKTAVKQTTSMLTSEDGNAAGHVYVVRILNGTGRQGLAGQTTQKYRDASYNMLPADNADTTYEETVVIDHIGNEAAAKNVGALIRCSNIRTLTEEEAAEEAGSSTASVDFTVILGMDFNGEVVR